MLLFRHHELAHPEWHHFATLPKLSQLSPSGCSNFSTFSEKLFFGESSDGKSSSPEAELERLIAISSQVFSV